MTDRSKTKSKSEAALIRELTRANARLEKEVLRLGSKCKKLEERLERFSVNRILAERHSSNSTGRTAEDFVRRLLGGVETERNADHDFVVGRKKFEVKGSRCNLFFSDKSKGYGYNRWTWHNFIGVGSQKTYTRLILIGEADPSRSHTYRDPKSPYVIFDVPLDFARKVAAERAPKGGRFAFHLISHRTGARSSILCQKIWDFEVTRRELKLKYKV